MTGGTEPIHVSLVATPDAMLAPVTGIYEALNAFGLLSAFDEAVDDPAPFRVEVVAPTASPFCTATGLSLTAHRTIDDVERTDIVIVPLMAVQGGEWVTGRYPQVVDWMNDMYQRGAIMSSACTGALLLAETGLLDGREATIHWAFAPTFRRNFPRVKLRLDRVLVVSGDRRELVMSGLTSSWHDLVLHLIARRLGPTVAHAMAKFMLLQWHAEGQAPYVTFAPPADHSDAVILKLQEWLRGHFAEASPVDTMARLSGLPERSFKRRFAGATGYSPITYVQLLRIEEAKRQLERSDVSVDAISWEVGYVNPAFFRRLFKRVTQMTPAEYRRKFKIPDFSTVPSETSAPRVA